MERNEWERENKGCRNILFILALIVLGLLIGAVILTLYSSTGDSRSQPEPLTEVAPAQEQPDRVPEISGSRSDNFGRNIMGADTVRNIVALCGDSVVRIAAEIQANSGTNPFLNDPFFQEFFGSPQPQTSLGSGFLFRQDGYILTNEHVISGAARIRVYLTSNEEPYEAEVVGTAPELDLAVIRIKGEDFPYLAIGDSDQVYVGDWVVAIGNPYGLDHTVTVGVISAMGRPLNIEGKMYQNLLQTDAAINPGNSGGPMLNLAGEVIGINTAVNASAQGIGFAIPSNTVLEVLGDLEAGIDRVRPWIGITMQELTTEMMYYFNLENIRGGVIVYNVTEGAPAQKAGIQRGDVILEIDGIAITGTQQVQSLIRSHKVGDIVRINVYRDGAELEFMVKLEASQN